MLDCDAEGRLTLQGFCELYHSQTSARAADTWRDLAALGYDKQLCRAGEAGGAAEAGEGGAAASGAAAGDAGAAAPPPTAALEAGLAACLPLVRAAKASRTPADVEAALQAVAAARAHAPGSDALADRLLQELRAVQTDTAAAGAAAASTD
jgi:hypothetical protein